MPLPTASFPHPHPKPLEWMRWEVGSAWSEFTVSERQHSFIRSFIQQVFVWYLLDNRHRVSTGKIEVQLDQVAL